MRTALVSMTSPSCSGGYTALGTLAAHLLLTLLCATSFHGAVDARTCTRPKNTLTFECNDLCTMYHPCLISDEDLYELADSDHQCGVEALSGLSTCVITLSDPCHYECFAVVKDTEKVTSYPTFSFFIPFGAYTSRQEKALLASDAAWAKQVAALAAINVSDSISWKNNDKVQKIDALGLADTCTDVCVVFNCSWRGFWIISDLLMCVCFVSYLLDSNIVGGSTEQSIKGKVANVVLATDLLSNNTFVTAVKLVNLNLETSGKTIAAMLPAAHVAELTLTNTLLPSFPDSLSTLTQLQTL